MKAYMIMPEFENRVVDEVDHLEDALALAKSQQLDMRVVQKKTGRTWYVSSDGVITNPR